MKIRGSIRKIALSALVLGAAGALSGCIVSGGGYHDDGYYDHDDYPPVHPNHGYRYAYPSGPTLIFDSGLGMYAVYGYPDYYFHEGYFYRWQSGYWNRSRYWDRSWSRCDSRHWPRPVYYVNNNYYGKGRRPQHDWDRGGHNDGDHHGDHGDRDDHGVRPVPGGPRGDLSGRGDSADRDAGHDAGPRRDDGDGDANSDGHRERGDRFIDAVRDQEQRGREQEVRERTREQNPSDERRQPDGDFRRGDRGRGEQTAARPEPAERAAAERPASEQRPSADRHADQRAEHAERHAAEQAERAERHTADQAERAQRQETERRRDEDRQSDDSKSSDSGEPDGEAGGARGDNWRSDRR